MKKRNICLILATSVVFLGVWTGTSASASSHADSWLGVWDTVTKIEGCPGPEPDGSWTGTFEVSREGDRYYFRWLNVDYAHAVDILTISQSSLEIRVHDPWGSEITFALAGEGKATYNQIQKNELDRDPPNPCARSNGVATRRSAAAPEEEKVAVPNLVGLMQDEAEKKILAANLRVGPIQTQQSNVPKGQVVSQSQPAGNKLKRGTVMGFTVSTGPPPVKDGIVQIFCPAAPLAPFDSTRMPPRGGSYPQLANIVFTVTATGGVPPLEYSVDWGDGKDTGWVDVPKASFQLNHAYDCPGVYQVTKVVRDTAHQEEYHQVEVEVHSTFERAGLGIEAGGIQGKFPDDWGSYHIKFTAVGDPTGGLQPYSYHWDFGDGGIRDREWTGQTNTVVHEYWNSGTYLVTLTIFDSCNSEVRIQTVLDIAETAEDSTINPVIGRIYGNVLEVGLLASIPDTIVLVAGISSGTISGIIPVAEDGSYSFECPAGEYEVTAFAFGYIASKKRVEVSEAPLHVDRSVETEAIFRLVPQPSS